MCSGNKDQGDAVGKCGACYTHVMAHIILDPWLAVALTGRSRLDVTDMFPDADSADSLCFLPSCISPLSES